MEKENILELRKVTKTFGDLVAVDSVDFALQAGEIHAILGENGAGKSTLMNLIYGLYQPSAGRIYVTDREGWRRRLQAKSPRDAIVSGIGMVHQHFMLVENLTVAENIALSLGQLRTGGNDGRVEDRHRPESSNLPTFQSFKKLGAFWFNKEESIEITEALSEQFGLTVDPSALVRTLSVGLKQRVEILKALSVDARILILDEPTAVLSPQEVEGFFTILRKLQADGRAIIFISHKMKEVLSISDRITVLRRGKKVYLGPTGELTARELAREMIGEEINEVERSGDAPLENETSGSVLQLSHLTVLGSRNEIAVSDVSMATHRGEIVGIAGVDGNGQRELAEAIMGLRHSESGTISILGTDPKGTKTVRQRGVGYIPEDRQTTGVIASFSVTENLLLNVTHLENTAPRWNVLNQRRKRNTTEQLIADYDIRPPIGSIPASALSGGNQQKIVLAREISLQPDLLIAVNPTRGLDVNAARYVHENLLTQRNQSKSVLLISTELDEVLLLSDRLYVMSRGKLIEATAQRNDIEALGLLMTGETDTAQNDNLKT